MATTPLGLPGRHPPADPAAPVSLVLNWGRRYRLTVVELGLACCALEYLAASSSMAAPKAAADSDTSLAAAGGDDPEAHVLVVAGTVTDQMAPLVRRLYDQLPEPRHVISFGACADCGGPYWDSYCVTKGVDQLVPVDVYVPGCPPRPEALLPALAQLQRRLGSSPVGLGRTLRPSADRDPPGPSDLTARVPLP